MSLASLWLELKNRTDYESCQRPRAVRFSLDGMKALMAHLGHPERAIPFLHVAGSKGKGSVCHFLEKGLRAAGFKTGLYTSPHLVDWRERIRVNGVEAEDSAVENALRQVLEASAGEETFFDLLTATALVVFRDSDCDVAVMETGLGGRFDSTNVVHSMAAVVTSVEAEHLDVLGPTLKDVGREKVGIFKAQSINWSAVPWLESAEKFQIFKISEEDAKDIGYPQPHMQANFQLAGAVLGSLPAPFAQASGALAELSAQDLVIAGHWQKETTADGRPVVFDTAHSHASLKAVLAAFRKQWPTANRGVVFALRDDKDAADLAKSLGSAPAGEDWWVCPAGDHPRSADPVRIAPLFGAQSLSQPQFPKGPEVLLVTGSTYLVGALLPLIHDSHLRRR